MLILFILMWILSVLNAPGWCIVLWWLAFVIKTIDLIVSIVHWCIELWWKI